MKRVFHISLIAMAIVLGCAGAIAAQDYAPDQVIVKGATSAQLASLGGRGVKAATHLGRSDVRQASYRFGCPTGASSCGSLDPIHNYMDYTDDLCMTEFTGEQTRRVRCTLQFYRPDLVQQMAVDFHDHERGDTWLWDDSVEN